MSATLEISPDIVEQIIVYLRKWHAVEATTSQNDGSNDTDDVHDNLEMHSTRVDRADLEGVYTSLNDSQKEDISALVLIGMEEESELDAARERIKREEGLSLDDLLEMPMSSEYLASALSRIEQADQSNVVRLHTPAQSKQP
ncbi:DUF3775 domain-containing protein [Aquisalinus flavus]|uniref:Uncharacterized protein n=1 Tax=Aquisalinus flavus TaxID=1526572 RepID=A0A8J2Y6P2_9PROT|nr:DUF3775 domain-containing protein [Aquisalinus flavus]MBD0425880.1 DUF3775 domain-containing protein [Aquisalinus flavus]UNE48523.1 DUF3775 domain-containing protein [Aquisalinus flavus]GGD12508.1 hypothetical protein GCM10011342_21630 [Aquisalinus flavus]